MKYTSLSGILLFCTAATLLGQIPGYDPNPPSTPTGLQVSNVTTGTIRLKWNPSVDPEGAPIDYEVWVNDFPKMTGIKTTEVTVRELPPCDTVTITVTAADTSFNASVQSEPVVVVMKCDLLSPEAPKNITLKKATPGTITLTWDASVDDGDISYYEININDDTVSYKAFQTEFTVWYLEPLTTHSVKIRAFDYAGHESPWTANFSAKTTKAEGKCLLITFESQVEEFPFGLVAGDIYIAKNLEEKFAYQVTMESYNSRIPDTSDIVGFDLAVISSTILSTTVGGIFKNSKVPIMIHEIYMADKMGMCSPFIYGTDPETGLPDSSVIISSGLGHVKFGKNSIVEMVNSSHTIAGGLTGTIALCTLNTEMNYEMKWIRPSENAVKIAKLPDDTNGTDRWVLSGYEEGSIMVDGTPAAGRRIAFGFDDNMAGMLSCKGSCLYDASISWLIKKPVEQCDCSESRVFWPKAAGQLARKGQFSVARLVKGAQVSYKLPQQERILAAALYNKQGRLVWQESANNLKKFGHEGTISIMPQRQTAAAVYDLRITTTSGITSLSFPLLR